MLADLLVAMGAPETSLIKQDERGRVLMAPGRGFLWFYGLLPIVIAFGIPIFLLSPDNQARRWVAVVFAIVLVLYLFLAIKWWFARWKRYQSELAARGLRHRQTV